MNTEEIILAWKAPGPSVSILFDRPLKVVLISVAWMIETDAELISAAARDVAEVIMSLREQFWWS